MSQAPKRRAVKRALTPQKKRTVVRTPNQNDPDVTELVAPYLESMRDNKARISKLAEAVEEDQIAVMNILKEFKDENGEPLTTVHIVAADGSKIQGTVVGGEIDTLDEGMLKKHLGTIVWNKLLTKILDKRKLDAYIASGEVDAAVVAACTTSTPKKKYVKVTVK